MLTIDDSARSGSVSARTYRVQSVHEGELALVLAAGQESVCEGFGSTCKQDLMSLAYDGSLLLLYGHHGQCALCTVHCGGK